MEKQNRELSEFAKMVDRICELRPHYKVDKDNR